MTAGMIRVLLVWGLLILLGAIEFLASYLPIDRAWRPLIMVPAVMMVLVVAIALMEVRKGPVIVRAFAVAAIFWLLVLLALGSADPLTRTNHYVPEAHVK
jgi:hypothetical protein